MLSALARSHSTCGPQLFVPDSVSVNTAVGGIVGSWGRG